MLTTIAPSVGAVICNLMFLSPLSSVLRARKGRELGYLNPIPWVAIVGNTGTSLNAPAYTAAYYLVTRLPVRVWELCGGVGIECELIAGEGASPNNMPLAPPYTCRRVGRI